MAMVHQTSAAKRLLIVNTLPEYSPIYRLFRARVNGSNRLIISPAAKVTIREPLKSSLERTAADTCISGGRPEGSRLAESGKGQRDERLVAQHVSWILLGGLSVIGGKWP